MTCPAPHSACATRPPTGYVAVPVPGSLRAAARVACCLARATPAVVAVSARLRHRLAEVREAGTGGDTSRSPRTPASCRSGTAPPRGAGRRSRGAAARRCRGSRRVNRGHESAVVVQVCCPGLVQQVDQTGQPGIADVCFLGQLSRSHGPIGAREQCRDLAQRLLGRSPAAPAAKNRRSPRSSGR